MKVVFPTCCGVDVHKTFVVATIITTPAIAITDYLTSDESFDPEHCVSLLQCSLKKKAEQVLEFIDGFSVADKQKTCIKIVREHYDFLEKQGLSVA